MFSDFIDEQQIRCVINGCSDCLLQIAATPRHYCAITKRKFGLDEVNNYKIKRPCDCPLPVTVKVTVKAHSYSDRENDDTSGEE